MINVKHFYQFLQVFTKVDANAGVPLPDLNAFYNEVVRRQRAHCQLTPNMFRSIFEMYVISMTNNYSIENATNRIPIIKGLGVTDVNASKFMNLVRYSLLSESNVDAVRSANGHYAQLNKMWLGHVSKHMLDGGQSDEDTGLINSLNQQVRNVTSENQVLHEKLATLEKTQEEKK